MSKRRPSSRELRQAAEEVLARFTEESAVPQSERQDLVTSLVRQWITYEGNATLFAGELQVYFQLGETPLGLPYPVAEAVGGEWLSAIARDWKLRPDQLPDALEQLNRGQSAELTNEEGVELRLWVNPRERSKGVEPLVKQPLPAAGKRDYAKIAARTIEAHVGPFVGAAEREALACSVARQWQKYQGVASIFWNEQQLVYILTELAEGQCRVSAGFEETNLVSVLCSLGIEPEGLRDAIARINLDQEVEFQDRDGNLKRLWHDPRARQVRVQALGPVRPKGRSALPPIFCPKCNAVLKLWRDDEWQQRCPHCGHVTSLS